MPSERRAIAISPRAHTKDCSLQTSLAVLYRSVLTFPHSSLFNASWRPCRCFVPHLSFSLPTASTSPLPPPPPPPPPPLIWRFCPAVVSVAPPPPPMVQLTPQIPLTGFVARMQESSKYSRRRVPAGCFNCNKRVQAANDVCQLLLEV